MIFGGQASQAVLNGSLNVSIGAFAVYNYIGALYAFEQPVLGGRLSVGAEVPFPSYLNTQFGLQADLLGSFSGSSSDFGLGDLQLNPFNLHWTFGELSVVLSQYVMAPTGHDDINNLVNVGHNYYWYKQIEGDSGSGAILGPFMGESFGLGPAVLWLPDQLKGRYALVLKWVHDLSATNRLLGDWGQVSMSWRF